MRNRQNKPKPVRITTYVDEQVYKTLQTLKREEWITSITRAVNWMLKDSLKKYGFYK
ncbi:MAG: hypothetical protein JJT76_06470 [Clostridiaceae bacterium]|nr:hypothetical protein [Clostridiaceae bacterium]